MRQRPYQFIQLGARWINMAMVTDVRDAGDKIFIFLASPMLARGEPGGTGGRRIVVKDPEEVIEIRRWMSLHD